MMGLMVPGTGWAEKNPYVANAVHFDGTSTYLTRGGGLTGAVDSQSLTISYWYKSGADGVTQRILTAATGVGIGNTYVSLHRNGADGRLVAQVFNSSLSIVATLHSDTDIGIVDSGWVHYICSFDLSDYGKKHVYANDVEHLDIVAQYNDDTEVIDFTWGDWSIGARASGADKINGDLADLLFWPGEYVDLSVASNRRMFIDAAGKPVDPAVSIAAMGTPIIALYGATSTWQVNHGSGGGLTENGVLTDASTSPSD